MPWKIDYSENDGLWASVEFRCVDCPTSYYISYNYGQPALAMSSHHNIMRAIDVHAATHRGQATGNAPRPEPGGA